jgi:xanthine/CO dehydrogenase XdhC/CoxF family maturation factor
MMLITRDGAFEGMISGGCLEGDLLRHAEDVFSNGEPRLITYDMHANENLVWDLGLGCDGIIHLMLQRLDKDSDFDFLDSLQTVRQQRKAAVLALVTDQDGKFPMGSIAMLDSSDISAGEEQLLPVIRELIGDWPTWRSRTVSIVIDEQPTNVMLIHVPPQTRVVICGAGPDAVPVARLLSELDWDVQIIDHRPAYAKPERFPDKCSVFQARPEKLDSVLDPAAIDAAVIMSHHLENDAEYLRQLAPHDIAYIGALGPRARRERLCEMANCPGRRVHGPVGLDIAAELPASIALSVVAEIHAVLNRRDGQSLTLRADAEGK